MNRAKAGTHVRVLPAPEERREEETTPVSIVCEDAETVVGGPVESEVLSALEPFWTRGIVLPPAGGEKRPPAD
jgi:hypothetical protein